MAEGEPRSALRELGIRARLGSSPVGFVDHILTHRRLSIDVYRASGSSADESRTLRQFRPEELDEVGISTLTRKILETALIR